MNQRFPMNQRARVDPTVWALARWISLARLAEPELVRSIRLQLEPGAHAGTEADLWWSELVESRTTRGIVLTEAAVRELRDELRMLHLGRDPRPSLAWSLIQQHHRHASPAVRLEEEIAWLSVSLDDPGSAIEQRLQPVLAAIVNDGRSNLGFWAGRALPYLPAIAREQPAAWYLEQYAHTMQPRLGSAVTTKAPAVVDPELLAAVTKSDQTTALGVLRWGDRLYLGDVGPDGSSIQVPRTEPRAVEVVREGSSQGSEVILVPEGERRGVAVGWSETVSLRTAHGEVYHLEPTDEEDLMRQLRAVTVTVSNERGQVGIGVIVGERLVATAHPDPGQLTVELGRARGSVQTRTLRRSGDIALLEVDGPLPFPDIPHRRRRQPPREGRCWSGIGLLVGDLDSPMSVLGLVRDPSFADIPGSPMLLQVRPGDSEQVRTGDSAYLLSDGSPVVIAGEIAGLIDSVVPDADFGGDGDLAYANWTDLWAVMYPNAADASPMEWMIALADLLQQLCLQVLPGRQLEQSTNMDSNPHLEAVQQLAGSLVDETVSEFVEAAEGLEHAVSLVGRAGIPDLDVSYLVSYLEGYDPRQSTSLSLTAVGGRDPLSALLRKHPTLSPIVAPDWRLHREVLALLEPSVFSPDQDLTQFLDVFLSTVGELVRAAADPPIRGGYAFSISADAASVLPLESMFGVSVLDGQSSSSSEAVSGAYVELDAGTLLEVFDWARIELIDALDQSADADVSVRDRIADSSGADAVLPTRLADIEPLLLNRAVLRQHLHALADPVGEAQVLVVNGPPGSGKTYTATYVEHVAEVSGFDVRYWRVTSETAVEDFSQEVAQSGPTRRDRRPVRDVYGTNQRYHRALATWLVAEQDRSGRLEWWILDGPSSAGTWGAEFTDFVIELAEQLQQRPSRIRLVLLGFDPDRLRSTGIGVRYEAISPINAWDIREFLEQHLSGIPSSTLDEAVERVLGDLPEGRDRLGVLAQRVSSLVAGMAGGSPKVE